MSKNINVNPGQYKVAGRERQGEDVVHEIEKREANRLRREEKHTPVSGKGAPKDRAAVSARSHKRTSSARRGSK